MFRLIVRPEVLSRTETIDADCRLGLMAYVGRGCASSGGPEAREVKSHYAIGQIFKGDQTTGDLVISRNLEYLESRRDRLTEAMCAQALMQRSDRVLLAELRGNVKGSP